MKTGHQVWTCDFSASPRHQGGAIYETPSEADEVVEIGYKFWQDLVKAEAEAGNPNGPRENPTPNYYVKPVEVPDDYRFYKYKGAA